MPKVSWPLVAVLGLVAPTSAQALETYRVSRVRPQRKLKANSAAESELCSKQVFSRDSEAALGGQSYYERTEGGDMVAYLGQRQIEGTPSLFLLFLSAHLWSAANAQHGCLQFALAGKEK